MTTDPLDDLEIICDAYAERFLDGIPMFQLCVNHRLDTDGAIEAIRAALWLGVPLRLAGCIPLA